jgi:hypothetical protein
MSTAYQKICQLLASCGFREHEIAEFAGMVSRANPRTLVEDVTRLRRFMSDSLHERALDVPSDASLAPTSEVEDKIERLLIHEAGLPRALAVEKLSSAIRLRFPNLAIPPEGRKGFRAWIGRLALLVPEKELLHIATSVRNQSVHEAPSDWRLK